MDVVKKYKKNETLSGNGRLRNCMNCGKRMRRHISTYNYAFCGKHCEILYMIKLKRKHIEENPMAYERVNDDKKDESVKLREGVVIGKKKKKKRSEEFKQQWYNTFSH